jgi:hypothetical protein
VISYYFRLTAFFALSKRLTAAFLVATAAGFAACAAATDTDLVLSHATLAPDFTLPYVSLEVTFEANESGFFPGPEDGVLPEDRRGFRPGSTVI